MISLAFIKSGNVQSLSRLEHSFKMRQGMPRDLQVHRDVYSSMLVHRLNLAL